MVSAEAITKDGWFKTGDIGLWRDNGNLVIIDRKKNIFKLSQGEYIRPEYIQGVYKQSKFIASIFVTGVSTQVQFICAVHIYCLVLLHMYCYCGLMYCYWYY